MPYGVAFYLYRSEGVTQCGYIVGTQGFKSDSHLHRMLGKDGQRSRNCSTAYKAISSFRKKDIIKKCTKSTCNPTYYHFTRKKTIYIFCDLEMFKDHSSLQFEDRGHLILLSAT